MLPDINLLLQFQAVMDHGSYTGAASQMHLSRQALTKNVQKMEQMLGGPLFEQRGRALVPTELARTLERHMGPLLSAWRTFSSQMEAELSGQWLSLFLAPGVFLSLGGNPYRIFGQIHPDIRISAEEGSSEEVVNRVKSGDAHVGLIGSVPAYLSDFTYMLLKPAGMWLLLPGDHPLSAKEELVPQDLKGVPICGPGRHNHQQRFFTEGMKRFGIDFDFSMISIYPNQQGEVPEEGICFGFPPSIVIPPEGWVCRHVLLPGEELFGTYAIKRKDFTLPAPARAFWEFLREKFVPQEVDLG